MRRTCILLALVIGPLLTRPCAAQSGGSQWAAQATLAPRWTVSDQFKTLFDADDVDITGTEFRIGLGRGRRRGGDWAIVYVRKRVNDDARASTERFDRVAHDITVSGVSIDKFASFGTIKERVQIGMVFGGGVGSAKGRATEQDRANGTVDTMTARQFFSPFGAELPVVPLARLELAAAVILAPAAKVRISGGFNYPGVSTATITGVVLFGGR